MKQKNPSFSYEDDRPFVIAHPGSPLTQLPARDALAHGNIKRSNKFPNCSFFRNWTSPEDKITWTAAVGESGTYEVVLYYAAKAAGATFGVSPGATEPLLATCLEGGLPVLPGAVTASEAMQLLSLGYDMLKFFPAEAAGGAAALKALGAPLPQISFCPTGGVTPENAGDYLSLANVVCAGGSWVAPKSLVQAGAWDEIEALAKEAAALKR